MKKLIRRYKKGLIERLIVLIDFEENTTFKNVYKGFLRQVVKS